MNSSRILDYRRQCKTKGTMPNKEPNILEPCTTMIRPSAQTLAETMAPETCTECIQRLCRTVDRLTVPSSDDGYAFVDLSRLTQIEQILQDAHAYLPFAKMPLARLYRHTGFDATKPYCLVSCHVDSVYDHYYSDTPRGDLGGAGERAFEGLQRGGRLLPAYGIHTEDDFEIRGTYDNAACNAILVDLMVSGELPPQVVVTFTGDEEYDSGGADQTIACLEAQKIREGLAFACVMDLTEEAYRHHAITIENIFKHNKELLSKRFPHGILEDLGVSVHVIKDAAPDESWQYDEHHCNAFSLCLPCRLLGEDMHEDEGVAIRLDALFLYRHYVAALLNNGARNGLLQSV